VRVKEVELFEEDIVAAVNMWLQQKGISMEGLVLEEMNPDDRKISIVFREVKP
jgi:hypothetical protein